jgi:hypothetical protein
MYWLVGKSWLWIFFHPHNIIIFLHLPLRGLWNVMDHFQNFKEKVLSDNQLHQDIDYKKSFHHSFNSTFFEVPILKKCSLVVWHLSYHISFTLLVISNNGAVIQNPILIKMFLAHNIHTQSYFENIFNFDFQITYKSLYCFARYMVIFGSGLPGLIK